MEKTIILTLTLCLSMLTAEAQIVFFGNGTTIEKKASITPLDSSGLTWNLGVEYRKLVIMSIPIWCSDKHYLIYREDELLFAEDEEVMKNIAAANNIALDDNPQPSFWYRFGGKLLLCVFLFGGTTSRSSKQ